MTGVPRAELSRPRFLNCGRALPLAGVLLVSAWAAGIPGPGGDAWAADADSVWTFANPDERFAADVGPGTLEFFDPFGTGWGPVATAFGSATSFGLPTMADGDPDVMAFPACGPGEGYRMLHGGAANGVLAGEGQVSNYTLILDVLFGSESDALWRSLYQTSPSNANDGEIFVENEPSGGIGIAGRYHGSIEPDRWHRVAISVRASPGEGQLHKFIDGTFVGGQGTTGSAIDGRWALDDVLLLFADESGDTASGFVAGVRFVDRQLSMEEIAALGGAAVGGPAVPGPPPADPYPYLLDRRVDIIAHRGNSCCAPENTLPALEQAFDAGARYIECDTRVTSDGVAVFVHDGTVDRTTDGTGAVASMTLAQLRALDAGSWFDPQYAGTRIPTLEEALLLAKAKGGNLYLDLKVAGAGPAIQAALTAAEVAESELWLWVYNNEAEAAALRSLMPEAKIIWGEPPPTWRTDAGFWQRMRDLGVFGFDLGSGTGNISQRFALAAREEGFYISNYTILDPESMIQSARNGANGIETDFPDILRRMQPSYSIEFYDPAPIAEGVALGAEQLNAVADIPGSFTYDPPAGTVLDPGQHPITASFLPDDAQTHAPRSVTVSQVVGSAATATFELDKSVYQYDEPIFASWTGAPGNSTDWVGIYENPGCGPVAEEFVCGSTLWLYVSGTQAPFEGVVDGSVVFDQPALPAGDYLAFFLREDGYAWIADPVAFRIEDPRPEIVSFTADPLVIAPGQTSVLQWTIDTRGAQITSVTIDNGVGEVTGDSVSVQPDFSTIYTLTVESPIGTVTATTQVFVEMPTPASLELDAEYFLPGQTIVATWTDGPGNPLDWVGIYRPQDVPGPVPSTTWLYVSGSQTPGPGLADGSVSFVNPGLPEGAWVAYLLENDGYNILAGPVSFFVDSDPPIPKPFVITAVVLEGDDLVVSWNARVGRLYRIEASPSLGTGWLEIDDSISADAEEMSYRIPDFRDGPNRFVRVGEQ